MRSPYTGVWANVRQTMALELEKDFATVPNASVTRNLKASILRSTNLLNNVFPIIIIIVYMGI